MDEKYKRLQQRFQRERIARKEAERIMENKSRQLYDTNKELERINHDLERMVESRTIELKANIASLQNANHELSELTRVVSHDLKSPLRAIGSLVAFLEEDLKDENIESDVFDYTTLIKKRVKRMQNLLNGILDYVNVSRSSSSIQNVNLDQLIKDLIRLDLTIPNGFAVIIKGQLLNIQANRYRMKQVFSNLIINAIKYHHNAKNGTVVISGKLTEDTYEISIKDDGPGISPRYHAKIFQIFQLLESRDKTESTGIGLPIVRKIIEHTGGEIKILSDVNQGANFIIVFPKSILVSND